MTMDMSIFFLYSVLNFYSKIITDKFIGVSKFIENTNAHFAFWNNNGRVHLTVTSSFSGFNSFNHFCLFKKSQYFEPKHTKHEV